MTGTAVLSLTSTSSSQAGVQAEIVAAALNIRQGPGLNYAVMQVALAGDKFEVVGKDTTGVWLQVMLPGGSLGWISGLPAYSRLLNGDMAGLPLVEVAAPASPGLSNAGPGSSPVAQTQSSTAAGGRLIFANRSGGDLYMINADGTDLRHLASGVIDPVVSPDGQQVAFTRWDGDEFGALYLLNLADGSERVITEHIRQPKSPTWSPDGQQMVISFQHGGLRDPAEECRRYDAGERVRIPENAVVTRHQSSGGGVSLCFVRKEDLQWVLREVDLASGAFEDLPSDEYAYNPTWDPQSSWRVIYDGNNGLMQLDVTNGEQWPLTEDLRDTGPVFSPDGRTLALTYHQHDHWEVYTLDPASHARQRLTKPPILATPQYNSAAPAWSPDGSQLAFMTDRTGRWEIWVMNVDGSQPRPLFAPDMQAQLGLEYHGVNERLLNWIK
jgi:dipeptidyl aminopeptidase/acylaminoacyl peptidase